MFAAFYHKNRVELPWFTLWVHHYCWGCFAWVTFRNMLPVIHYLNCKSRCSSCTTWEATRLQNQETIAPSILKWNLFIMYWPIILANMKRAKTTQQQRQRQCNSQTIAQQTKTPTTKREHSKTPANREKRKAIRQKKQWWRGWRRGF